MHVESNARKELHGRSFQLWAVSGTSNFPRRDFAQKVKSWGGTLVIRVCIKESTYSWYMQSVCQKKILICQNRGREEWVGNDDVSIVCAHKYEMVRMT